MIVSRHFQWNKHCVEHMDTNCHTTDIMNSIMGLEAKKVIFDTTIYVTPTLRHHDLLHWNDEKDKKNKEAMASCRRDRYSTESLRSLVLDIEELFTGIRVTVSFGNAVISTIRRRHVVRTHHASLRLIPRKPRSHCQARGLERHKYPQDGS